ncbi:hypothetical protein N9W34_03885 [Rickettsiales bacterium]|nr:hypothetical protein [Rickettsiales bacterium]
MQKNKVIEWLQELNRPAEEFTKSFARLEVVSLIIHYSESKNPFFIWEIIALCSKHSLPFPRMAKDYLALSAENIIDLATITEEVDSDNKRFKKRKPKIMQRITAMLGLKSEQGKDLVGKYNLIKSRLNTTSLIDHYIETGLCKTYSSEFAAEELGVGDTTVRDAHKYFKEEHNVLDTPLAASWYNLPLDYI